jgi:pyridoxine 5-phosphate synthase
VSKKKILLGVNIDHVATLRQARLTSYPDPVEAALLAENAGADSITIHLREDRRHIQDDDVFRLKSVMQTAMNLEMAVTDEMVSVAEKVKPEYCCLVPEKRQELTTEGGLDIAENKKTISRTIKKLHDAGIRVSLFIDADKRQILAAAEVGAKVIEIHTGHYANALEQSEIQLQLQRVIKSTELASANGLQVNAGHGLTIDNVSGIAAIDDIVELNIGHSIIARSVFLGIENAVKEIKTIMLKARS